MDNKEYKVITSNTPTFGNPAKLKQILAEEAQAGWDLEELIDSNKIRVSRDKGVRRLAIEVDCDGRVLRRERCPAAYGRLLIEVGRLSSRGLMPVTSFAESPSLLERRIRLIAGATTSAHPGLRAGMWGCVLLLPLAVQSLPVPQRPDLGTLWSPSPVTTRAPLPGSPSGGRYDLAAARLGREPTFTPYDLRPELRNAGELGRAIAALRETHGQQAIPASAAHVLAFVDRSDGEDVPVAITSSPLRDGEGDRAGGASAAGTLGLARAGSGWSRLPRQAFMWLTTSLGSKGLVRNPSAPDWSAAAFGRAHRVSAGERDSLSTAQWDSLAGAAGRCQPPRGVRRRALGAQGRPRRLVLRPDRDVRFRHPGLHGLSVHERTVPVCAL